MTALAYFVLVGVLGFTNATFNCKDPRGENVDWFSIYKLPEMKSNPDPLISQGWSHMYLDGANPKWTLSNVSMDDHDQASAQTLQQIYDRLDDNSDSFFYAMYNDEWPDGSYSLDCGHTKGVVAFDNESGIWIIQSVPKYPPAVAYSYPWSGRYYGQSYLCITFPYSELNKIGLQLRYTEPRIYSATLPEAIAAANPDLKKAISGDLVTAAPHSNRVNMTSSGGVKFVSFAKHRAFGKDLYYDFVAPELKTNILVETWQHGSKNNIGSSCNGSYTVQDVATLKLPDSVDFPNKDDHSKWAVADTHTNDDDAWVCIGDVNRQKSQFVRGGGTMCLSDPGLWATFRQSVATINSC